MIKIGKTLLIIIIFVFVSSLYGQSQANYLKQLNEAKMLINTGKGAEALSLLSTLDEDQKSVDLYILQGRASAVNNQPKNALSYYQKALRYAGNNEIYKRVSMFGISKIQLWMENYKQAQKTFRLLLKMNLSAEDKKIALAGLEKSNEALMLDQAKSYINADNGVKALDILRRLVVKKPSFDIYILLGHASAINNQPKKALIYYQKALKLANKNPAQERAALFSVGKMQLWLENYLEAEKVFKKLMSMKLNILEYEIAMAGLVRSLAYQDKPMQAYRLIPVDYVFTMPEMIISASQAALLSGWHEKSKTILEEHKDKLHSISTNSYLNNDLKDVEYHAYNETANNIIEPAFYFEQDSDGLTIEHYNTSYAKKISKNLYFGFAGSHHYIKDNNGSTHADSLLLTNNFRINDYMKYFLSLAGAHYDNWSPFLWSGKMSFKPIDQLAFSVSNSKEVIETIQAINNKITYNLTDLNVVMNPIYRLRLIGACFYGDFSSNNRRKGYFVSAKYLLSQFLGLGFEYRMRGYRDSNIQRLGYFSPKSFSEENFIVNLTRKFASVWRYYFDVSVLGRQKIRPGENSDPFFMEAGIRGFICKNLLLDIYYGYSRSEFSSITGDYSRKYGQISLRYLF